LLWHGGAWRSARGALVVTFLVPLIVVAVVIEATPRVGGRRSSGRRWRRQRVLKRASDTQRASAEAVASKGGSECPPATTLEEKPAPPLCPRGVATATARRATRDGDWRTAVDVGEVAPDDSEA